MIEESHNTASTEIDLSVVFIFIKTFWKKIIITGFIFGFTGICLSFLFQKEYVAQAKLLPEMASTSTSKLSGGLGALAGLAGIDISAAGGSMDALRPDLYPNIIQSVLYSLYILQQKVYVSEPKKLMTVEELLKEKQKTWLSQLMKSSENASSLLDPQKYSQAIELTREKETLIKEISSRVAVSFDRKTGVITLSAKMPDPVAAASVTNLTIEYLITYVTKYRTEKAKRNLEFVKKQLDESKRRYQNAESALASYQDRNRSLILQTAKIQEARLTSDFTLAQSIYNDLNRQYEQAKIKLEEETPVLKVHEPTQIPLQKSEPKRRTFFSVFFAIGAICAVIFIIFKNRKLVN